MTGPAAVFSALARAAPAVPERVVAGQREAVSRQSLGGARVSLRAGTANRSNFRFGSCADLRHPSGLGRVSGGKPTLSPERRQTQSKHEGITGAAGCAAPRGAATSNALTAPADLLLSEHVYAAHSGPRVRPRVFRYPGARSRDGRLLCLQGRYADHQLGEGGAAPGRCADSKLEAAPM
jgi:hypothetical protein